MELLQQQPLTLAARFLIYSKNMARNFFYKAAGAVLAPFRYAEREVKILKENLKEDAQEVIAKILKIAVMVFCSVLFLLFISITAAMVMNRALESEWAGFAIVAGFYLLAGMGVYIWKESDKKNKNAHQHQQHQGKAVNVNA